MNKINKNIPIKINPIIRWAGIVLTIFSLLVELVIVLGLFGVLEFGNIYTYISLIPISYFLLIVGPICFMGYIPYFVTLFLPDRVVQYLPRDVSELLNDYDIKL